MKRTTDSRGILGTLMYLAFGLLVYVVLFEPDTGFSWADPWVYIISVFWPLALIYKFTVAIILLILIAVAIAFVADKVAGWRDHRSNRGAPDID